MTVCRHCGFRNPDDAAYCSSCGWPLQEDAPDDPVIIDVTDDDAEIVTTGEEVRSGSFTATYVGPARVYVTSSGNRGCLIAVAVVFLAICCVCAGWLAFVENVLF